MESIGRKSQTHPAFPNCFKLRKKEKIHEPTSASREKELNFSWGEGIKKNFVTSARGYNIGKIRWLTEQGKAHRALIRTGKARQNSGGAKQGALVLRGKKRFIPVSRENHAQKGSRRPPPSAKRAFCKEQG